MKSLLTIAFSGLLLIGCQQSSESGGGSADTTASADKESSTTGESAQSSNSDTTLVSFNPDGAPTREFNIDGMHCQYACVDKVKTVLKKQQGVKDVKVDFDSKLVTVAVDNSTFNANDAIASLADYEFTATKVKEN